jgi:hypothetical protein
MAVRHAERIAADAGETGHIRHLLEYAGIHGPENGLSPIDAGRHQHAGFLRDGNLPHLAGNAHDLHGSIEFHTSRTTTLQPIVLMQPI